MTSPLSRISTGSFFSGVMREYSSLAWPGATVGGHEFDLVDQPGLDRGDANLAGERRGGGEGEFHEMSYDRYDDEPFSGSSLRGAKQRSNPVSAARYGMDCFASLGNDLGCRRGARALRRDDLLALFAEALDAERDDVADIEDIAAASCRCRRRAGCRS